MLCCITRAKETLYITSSEVRRVFGRTVAYPQSDFIGEIRTDLKEYINGKAAGTPSRAKVFKPSAPAYNPHSLRKNFGDNRTYASANPQDVIEDEAAVAKMKICELKKKPLLVEKLAMKDLVLEL